MAEQAKKPNNLRRNVFTELTSGGFWSCVALSAFVTFCYFFTKPWWQNTDSAVASCSVGLCLCLIFLGLFLLLLKRKGCLTPQKLLLALVAVGILLRVFYMLYTPFTWRGHDIYDYDGHGHFGYIYRLMTGQGLPDSNANQFYHPPLMHLVSAAFCTLCRFFTGATDPFDLVDPAKIVSTMASVSVLITSLKIGRELGLKQRGMMILAAVSAFFPTYFILSASVNNDALMLAFFMGAIYYTLRWQKNPTMAEILKLAVCIGCAMMSKLSGGLVAFFTALVFLLVFIQNVKKEPSIRNIGGYVGQFAAFAGVCFPLALWYPIRNLILFDQPLTYVLYLSEDSTLYCGNVSFAERFLSFPLKVLAESPYCHPFGDSNLWVYTLKCSVFGEFSFDAPDALAYLLLLANGLLILLSLAAMVYVLIGGKKLSLSARFAPAFLWLCLMISFVRFNLLYPFGCTMDFRYIVPTLFVGAYYLAAADQMLGQSTKPFAGVLQKCGVAMIFVFCASALIFYF